MRFALLVVVATALSACGPKLIPGTEIRDSDESRQILSVVAAYRSAVENRNVEKIVSLASHEFFERATEPKDSYDFKGLGAKLKAWSDKTTTVKMAVTVKEIAVEGDAARARYWYDLNYQLAANNPGEQPTWGRESDTKEMAFKRENGAWRIVGGI